MASSLIRINEATIIELQALRGIGPRRAEYIFDYRNAVTPICNTFDLATATGLGLKASQAIADQIDWTDKRDINNSTLIPFLITSTISIWLIFTGFDQITREPWAPPGSYLNFALALILMGGLASTGDIAISLIRKLPSETSWVFLIAVVSISTGIAILAALVFSVPFKSYPIQFVETLGSTVNFLIFALIIVYLIYGPAVFLRVAVAENRAPGISAGINTYDYSQVVIVAISAWVLLNRNYPLPLEEIFSIWCIAIVLINGLDLIRDNSAFVNVLSGLDQGRLRFINRRIGLLDHLSSRQPSGYLAITSSLLLLALTIFVLWRG